MQCRPATLSDYCKITAVKTTLIRQIYQGIFVGMQKAKLSQLYNFCKFTNYLSTAILHVIYTHSFIDSCVGLYRAGSHCLLEHICHALAISLLS